jgi:hypothetical protein
MKKGMIALLALAFTSAVVVPALAEDPAGPVAQDQKSETLNLRQEIVKLKYVRAQDIQQVIYPFLGPRGIIRFNDNMPMFLTVSAGPEDINKVLAVIRELDVKPADILYTVQLVLGSESDATTDAELQSDPVIKELRKLLRYKGYTLLDSSLLRVVNRERASVVLGPKAEFEFALRPDVAGEAKAPVIKTEVRLQQTIRGVKTLSTVEGKETNLQTTTQITTPIESTLNIKSGERTVVGVSKLDGGDKGLILIISAKIID